MNKQMVMHQKQKQEQLEVNTNVNMKNNMSKQYPQSNKVDG